MTWPKSFLSKFGVTLMSSCLQSAGALSVALGNLEEAIVVDRPNRFIANVRLGDGSVALAHIADSGRLRELIFPGNIVMVRRVIAPMSPVGGGDIAESRTASRVRSAKERKTPYDLVLASIEIAAHADDEPQAVGERSHISTAGSRKIWVSVDTRYPNIIMGQVLRAHAIPEIEPYGEVSPEYWYHHLSPWKEEAERERLEWDAQKKVQRRLAATMTDGVTNTPTSKDSPMTHERGVRSRMDFFLRSNEATACQPIGPGSDVRTGRSFACGVDPSRGTLVEVKSVTLCVDGVGYFPDAPTDRGVRHLHELIRGVKEGYRAFAVFMAQRDDIETIKPNRETDPEFADTLQKAQESGVHLLGLRCSVTPKGICLCEGPVPVIAK